MKHFRISFLVTFICLAVAGWWGYQSAGWSGALTALGIAVILGVMEVSLSFDNAVVNASVLKTWDAFWQKLFLGVGIIIAVFGMRLLFPLVIVAVAADISIFDVWTLALNDPKTYSKHLTDHHAEVAAFGGIFLLLVFLNFLLDHEKEMHWLGNVEKKLGSLGKVSSIAVMVAMGVLLGSLSLVAEGQKLVVLVSGMWGILVYVGVDAISNLLEKEEEGSNVGDMVKRGGIGGFLYLEVLDASFSFDGVIGAFAITSDVVIIMLGLAIGAMFVRSMTVYLVHKGTLDQYVYLEHGAHYAIGILAVIMLASMKFHIPEIFTGLIGVAFILASLWSSVRYRKKQEALALKAA
ncbi:MULTISPECIES: DUF475 domain-containing protein [Telluria group]|uniref:DUF475 domain-containing protein n=1 Tax=Pseudoduganella violacea TaxID=1715466 RepID=A0A7W5B9T5_9BURK|nr:MULTISPECIES: DUF475 domain-containing protein [Telluria group]AKU22453.1 hypothetical protein ACZ75_14225 [Massilia sp. NR 4-1]MBB3119217.1 hypothetical protein [Pseudoduganella violacea]NVE01075.1 DUF475 domain-containing protein [Massilia sp. BJB1822]UMR32762.1 DUF475 domain-containing protein [Massilia sp. MB5]UTY56313.1 DUF475 domain-containing protein [Massilia sp. erpn]